MTGDVYSQWLAALREQLPPPNFTHQVMDQVLELERQRQGVWWLRLIQHVEQSPAGRWAVCGGALAVGSLPFVFLAYVARFVAF